MKFLQGKKTYIGAALIAIAAVAGYFAGVISPEMVTGAFGVAISISGLASKLERFIGPAVQAMEVARELQQKQISAAAAVTELEPIGVEAARLVPELHYEPAAASPKTVDLGSQPGGAK